VIHISIQIKYKYKLSIPDGVSWIVTSDSRKRIMDYIIIIIIKVLAHIYDFLGMSPEATASRT